jgi:predicted HicB family RNase H-like nuclease
MCSARIAPRKGMATSEQLSANLLLRMPPQLKAELREEAQKNRRSLNSEILYRLFRSLNEYSR